MVRQYTLKSGEVIHTWYDHFGRVRIYKDRVSDEEVCTLIPDTSTGVPIIEYKGEKINVEEYDHMPLEELLDKVEECQRKDDRWAIRQDDALATIMKESDRIGFVMEVNCFDTIVPGLGFGFKSDRIKMEALMIPFEDRWKKNDWHYKIELMAEEEEVRPLVGRETMYFSDLWSSVMTGKWIRIVDRNKYREEHKKDKVINGGKVTVIT